MGGQCRIDLVVQHVVYAVLQGAVGIHPGHLGIGRLDGELAAHAILGVIHQGILEKRQAAPLEPGLEAF